MHTKPFILYNQAERIHLTLLTGLRDGEHGNNHPICSPNSDLESLMLKYLNTSVAFKLLRGDGVEGKGRKCLQ